MKLQKASDIKRQIKEILKQIDFSHIDHKRIFCFRSFGSSSRARARIWSFPKIWQEALEISPCYIIEVLSEKFDKLSLDNQRRILIHELLHIPKNFSGSLRPHRARKWRINSRMVEKLFAKIK